MAFLLASRPSGLRINPRDRGTAHQDPVGRAVTGPDIVSAESGFVRPDACPVPAVRQVEPATGRDVPPSASSAVVGFAPSKQSLPTLATSVLRKRVFSSNLQARKRDHFRSL